MAIKPLAVPERLAAVDPKHAMALVEKNFDAIYQWTQQSVNAITGLVPAVISPGDLLIGSPTGALITLAKNTTATRYLANTGVNNAPAWDQVNLSNGVTSRLQALNQLPQFSATKRVWGRNTTGAGDAEEVTVSQILDWLGTAAQGDIIYRDASTWNRLAAGVVGQFLQTNGASANPVWASIGGGNTDFINQEFIFWSGIPPNVGIAWGHTAPTSAAGATATTRVTDSTGTYLNCPQASASANLRAGMDAGDRNLFEADANPTLEFVLQTPSAVTNLRLWFLMSDTQVAASVDDLGGTSKYMGFRFSTVAGDGGWVGVCRDGSTQSVTGTVAAIAASTLYKLKIRKSGSTVFFSVNGGAETSQTNNLPAAGTRFGIDQISITTAAALRAVLLSRYRAVWGG